MKTFSATPADIEKKWIIIDAEGVVLGRLASIIAIRLRGKHKPSFTPHMDCGDNVIVLNAAQIKLTGNKWEQKKYIRHTGYPGGQRILNPIQIHNKSNTRLVEKSVRGMLPKNKLGASLFRNLRVYKDENHIQDSQSPKIINIKDYL